MAAQRTAGLLAAGCVAALLVGAFLLAGFSAADHRTAVDRQLTTATTNDAPASVPGDLVLYVFGPDPTSDRLETAVAAAAERRGASVRVVNRLEPTYDDPVLVVGVDRARLSYSPITPSADVSLSFVYAPGGNVTQFGRPTDDPTAAFDAALLRDRLLDDDPLLFRVDDENRAFRSGRLRLRDETIGVSSRPAYRAHVTETLASRTVDAALGDGA